MSISCGSQGCWGLCGGPGGGDNAVDIGNECYCAGDDSPVKGRVGRCLGAKLELAGCSEFQWLLLEEVAVMEQRRSTLLFLLLIFSAKAAAA